MADRGLGEESGCGCRHATHGPHARGTGSGLGSQESAGHAGRPSRPLPVIAGRLWRDNWTVRHASKAYLGVCVIPHGAMKRLSYALCPALYLDRGFIAQSWICPAPSIVALHAREQVAPGFVAGDMATVADQSGFQRVEDAPVCPVWLPERGASWTDRQVRRPGRKQAANIPTKVPYGLKSPHVPQRHGRDQHGNTVLTP